MSERTSLEFLPVCTLALWLFCLTIGVTGLAMPYARPHPPSVEPEPVQAELLKVDLASEPLPPPATEPIQDPLQPPPLLEPINIPQAPPMLAVAEPGPAIAFALPVKQPARVVDASQASYVRPAENASNAVTPSIRPPQPLTFGEGEGKQPAPEYPLQAMRQGQEGAVAVRLKVGENGRVLEADSVSPSPWPLLNHAAVRVVRERWRFRPGPVRFYEVTIRFQIHK